MISQTITGMLMKCELTIDGLEMCIKNSIRLLTDSCKRGLSLQTVGAIVEIGLEEAAKAFFIMLCLMKNETIKEYPDKSKKEDIKQSSYLNQKIKELIGKFNCDEDIDQLFKYHKVKTNLINDLGSFLHEPENYLSSNIIKNSATKSFKDIEPGIEENEVKKALSDPKMMSNTKERIESIERATKIFSSEIKERGFYVDCGNHSFRYPFVEKETIKDLSSFLFTLIYLILKITESNHVKFKNEFTIHSFKGEFYSLQKMLE